MRFTHFQIQPHVEVRHGWFVRDGVRVYLMTGQTATARLHDVAMALTDKGAKDFRAFLLGKGLTEVPVHVRDSHSHTLRGFDFLIEVA